MGNPVINVPDFQADDANKEAGGGGDTTASDASVDGGDASAADPATNG